MFNVDLQAPQLAGVQFNRPNTALGVQPTLLGQARYQHYCFFIGLWLVSLSLLVLTFLLLSLFWSLPVFLTIITIAPIIFILMTILVQGRPDLNLFNLFGR